MNYTDKCLERFENLPESIKKELGGFEALSVVERLEDEYGVDTSFIIILVAIGELSLDNVSEYLEAKYEFSEEDALELTDELRNGVFSRIFRTELGSDFDKKKLKEFLQEKLDVILKSNEEAEAFNYNAFLMLSSDGSFISELEKAITESQVEIGSERIEKEDKKIAPTVANWIKDFIRINGSDNFNDLVIINYLSNSKNAKNLSEEDKKLLFKVFKTYRNAAFFVENSEKLPANLLEIIPIDRDESELVREKLVKKTNDSQKLNNVLADSSDDRNKQVKSSPNLISVSEPVIPADSSVFTSPVILVSTPTDELQNALINYGENSLEYKAIKQELKRLNQSDKTKK